MRLNEFDQKALMNKMQALIDDPNTNENMKAMARDKLEALKAQEEEQRKTPQKLDLPDFSDDTTQGTYDAKGRFKPWDYGKSEFRPINITDIGPRK